MNDKSARRRYFQNMGTLAKKPAYASRCIQCGKCESHCPQAIAIRQELKQVSKVMEGTFYKLLIRVIRKILKLK